MSRFFTDKFDNKALQTHVALAVFKEQKHTCVAKKCRCDAVKRLSGIMGTIRTLLHSALGLVSHILACPANPYHEHDPRKATSPQVQNARNTVAAGRFALKMHTLTLASA